MEISSESRLEMKETSSQQNPLVLSNVQPDIPPPVPSNPPSHSKATEEIPSKSIKKAVEKKEAKASSSESKSNQTGSKPDRGRWSKEEVQNFCEGKVGD